MAQWRQAGRKTRVRGRADRARKKRYGPMTPRASTPANDAVASSQTTVHEPTPESTSVAGRLVGSACLAYRIDYRDLDPFFNSAAQP
jgi:hypothetical protein